MSSLSWRGRAVLSTGADNVYTVQKSGKVQLYLSSGVMMVSALS